MKKRQNQGAPQEVRPESGPQSQAQAAADLQKMFQSALALHQRGEIGKAADQYREILRIYPRHADVLHLMGVIAAQVNDWEKAESLIRRAIAIYPGAAVYHNSLGAVYRQHKKLEEARACFDQAIALDGKLAEAYNNLGVVEREQGKLDRAMELYRKALELRPNYGDAYSNIGGIHLARAEIQEAKTALTRALELNPNHAEAHSNLGVVLRMEGKKVEALKELERSVNLKPAHVPGYLEIGAILTDMGDYDQAIRAFDEVLSREPDSLGGRLQKGYALFRKSRIDESEEQVRSVLGDHPASAVAHTQLGTILRARGRLDEAIAEFQEALRIAPNFPAAYQQLAQTERQHGLDVDKVESLVRIADSDKANEKQRSGALFTLGKMHDDAELYDEAFGYYRRANDLVHEPYDPEAQERRIDRIIEVFDADFFAARRGLGSPSDRPVFIVGMPRSGTTLTEQIVASHSRVYGGGERPFIFKRSGVQGGEGAGQRYPDNVLQWTPEQIAQIAADYLAELPEEARDALRVTDKMPVNTHYLGVIALLFPNARIIHARRHPLDTCLSCYFQNFAMGQNFSYRLDHLGHYYRQYLRLMEHWRKVLPLPILEADYETLVDDQEAQSRRLIEFIGLEWDQQCLEFYENSRPIFTASVWQVRQPMYATSKERWRHYLGHLQPLLDALGPIPELGDAL
jgi:tetratricopeptide (TPR) repeat protein